VREAVEAYFFDSTPPKHIRLHLVRDEDSWDYRQFTRSAAISLLKRICPNING